MPPVNGITATCAVTVIGSYYEDISPYRGGTGYTYPVRKGYVFAGWYEDEKFSIPIEKTVTEDPAYAKFVDEKVLTKIQIS